MHAGQRTLRTIVIVVVAWVIVGFTINAMVVIALSQWGVWGKARYHNSEDPTAYGVLVGHGSGVSWAMATPAMARFIDTSPTAPGWIDFGTNPSPAWGAHAQFAMGWPARCATGTRTGISQATVQHHGLVHIPMLGSLPGASGDPTPYFPLWRGVAINILVLGSPALLLLLIPPVRALRRRRNGQCPRCAYDLKHDFANGCSECGWGKPNAKGKA